MKLKIIKKVHILLYIMMITLLSSIVLAIPIVTLVSPEDETSTYNQTINMSCNASWAGVELMNLTLYINDTLNSTNITSVTNNTNYVFLDVSFGLGDYYWNCKAEDNNTNISWASSNFTLSIINCTYECTSFESCYPDITGGLQNCTIVNETGECIYAGDYTEYQEQCNYCTLEELVSRGDCINDTYRQNDYDLTNNETCCALTGNNTDCTVSDSYNSSCGYAKQYDSGEAAEVGTDLIVGIGVGLFSFVVIIALVLLYLFLKKRV